MNEKSKSTIMIVDDEPLNIKILFELLKNDYRIHAVNNGKKALDIASSLDPPDLILLDIMMPGIDGYEVCRKLKSDSKTQDIPVIFITALGNDEDEIKGFNVGAVDYVTKPFNPVIVKARVRTHIKLKLATQELAVNNAALISRIEELENAKSEIKSLQSFIPICSYCKNIRNDQNYWDEVESYLSQHSDIQFSHSICPACYEEHVKPQLAKRRAAATDGKTGDDLTK